MLKKVNIISMIDPDQVIKKVKDWYKKSKIG